MHTRLSTLALVALAGTALSGCSTTSGDPHPAQGLASVNVPVVERADYAFDVAAPNGMLASGEAGRLDAWFRGLDLGYGDSIAVDGAVYAPSVRSDVGAVAGRYGLMVSDAAPVTPGQIAPGNVRVVVSRTRASVPGCPNWGNGQNYQNWHNETMPGFGCAVNGNLAAMVANPNDLVFGREGSGVGDARTGSKAVDLYRTAPTTGAGGLKDISTKKGG